MYQYSPGTKGGKEFQQWEMAAASIPLHIICHVGQGALASDPTSSHGDATLVVMCQHHDTFQLIADSTDAVGYGKECWK